jgi:hypothetical protein
MARRVGRPASWFLPLLASGEPAPPRTQHIENCGDFRARVDAGRGRNKSCLLRFLLLLALLLDFPFQDTPVVSRLSPARNRLGASSV